MNNTLGWFIKPMVTERGRDILGHFGRLSISGGRGKLRTRVEGLTRHEACCIVHTTHTHTDAAPHNTHPPTNRGPQHLVPEVWHVLLCLQQACMYVYLYVCMYNEARHNQQID
jgi:hypothetical protein